ncbi:MAG: hypothetical protein WA191_22880, partial [Telluria sp.]
MSDDVTTHRIARYLKLNGKGGAILLSALVALTAPAIAATSMPEGMIGWSYGPRRYESNPVAACKAMSMPFNLQFTYIEPAMVQGYWNGTSFFCHFIFPKISGTDYYFPTGLFCEGGYYARWPGVCVPFLSQPPTPTCSPNEPGFAVGNPVMVSTGVKIQSEVDPVGGASFNISRTYRSVRIPLWQPTAGIGWSFSFERQFRVYPSSKGKPPYRVDIVTGDGTYIEFRFDNGRYVSASNSADLLVPATEKYDEWTYTGFSGKIDSFKQFGKRFLLVSSLEKEGTGMYFSYDADMKLKSISDSFGRLLEVTWSDPNGIGSISAKESSIKYHYEQQMLTPDRAIPEMIRILGITLHDASGDMVGDYRYHYEGDDDGPRFFLSGITDANGDRFATYSYDGSGRVLLSEHAGGAERHRFSYEKGRTVVTDPSGAERVFTLNKAARVTAINQPGGAGCGPAASTLAYDSFGVLASRTDFNNNKTCLKYEPKRPLEIRRIEGLAGTATCPNVNAPVGVGQRVISTKWHPDWKAETRIAEPQKITTYVYNGQPDLDGTVLSCAAGGTLTNGKPVAVLCKKIEQATNDLTGAQGFTAAQVGSAKVWTFS